MLVLTVLLAVPTPRTLQGGSHTALQAAQISEGFRQQWEIASSIGICQVVEAAVWGIGASLYGS
jgi:hypothetical protein